MVSVITILISVLPNTPLWEQQGPQPLTQGLAHKSDSIYICWIEQKFWNGLWSKVKATKPERVHFWQSRAWLLDLQSGGQKTRQWTQTMSKGGLWSYEEHHRSLSRGWRGRKAVNLLWEILKVAQGFLCLRWFGFVPGTRQALRQPLPPTLPANNRQMCLWGCHWTGQAEADRSTSNWKNKTFFPSKGVVHFWEQIQILYLSLVSILIQSEQDKSVCVYAVVGVGLGGVLKFWQTRYWMPKSKPHGHIPTFLFTWQKQQEKNSKKKGLIQLLGRVDSKMQIWLKFLKWKTSLRKNSAQKWGILN